MEKLKTRFYRVPDWIIKLVNGNAIKAWCALTMYDLPEGCYPSLETMCVKTKMNVRTLRRSIAELKKIGAVSIKKRGYRRSNVYMLHWENPEVARLKKMPYSEYLKTEHWLKTRKAALARAKYACQVCATTKRLNVHHRTYENRGCEHPEDLTVLCEEHHALYHGK